jgi:NADPH-dependent curcumin reductase CurA
MSTITSRAIRLRSRPTGEPTADNFELAMTEISTVPPQDHLLVRNLYVSVDPYMRGRMRDGRSYATPFALGETLTGGAVGEVVASSHPDFAPGDHVLHNYGWREYADVPGKNATKIDTTLAPIQSFLGVLGMPGRTAYVGLLDIGQPKAGETVFVSGAAGAVGSLVCQIAKLQGCRVVGSAGSETKVRWLYEQAGVDAAINYRETKNLRKAIAAGCPDGVDVYFENVGGDHLEATLSLMNDFGRIVACGMISQYNASEPAPGPRNLGLIVGRRLKIQGFIVSDHPERTADFYRDMSAWMAAGKIRWEETVVEGLANAPTAFLGLFHGENLGKMLVKLV